MPIFSDLKVVTITAAGGTYTMQSRDRIGTYVFDGSGTLLASYAITADMTHTLITGKPARVKIFYKGNWELDGNQITVFGTPLTAQQALLGNTEFDCFYDGSAWTVQVVNQPYARTYSALQSVDISAGLTLNVNPNTDGKFIQLIGTGALGGDVNITCTPAPSETIRSSEEFYVTYTGDLDPNGYTITIFGVALTDTQVAAGKVSVYAYYDYANTAFVTQVVQDPTVNEQGESIVIPVSFETDEQCNNSIIAAFNGTIEQEDAFVTKELANTDAGTITVQINGTPVTNGAITIPLSSPLDTQVSATPTALNTFVKGDIISAVTAKTTAGGKALLTLTAIRTQ
jgi:hypothetical protein